MYLKPQDSFCKEVEGVRRYQYLELAFFLTYGHCPDQQPSEYGYILSEQGYSSWAEFYTNSSAMLTVEGPLQSTREICLCARFELKPKMTTERRHFVFEDVKVWLFPCSLVSEMLKLVDCLWPFRISEQLYNRCQDHRHKQA